MLSTDEICVCGMRACHRMLVDVRAALGVGPHLLPCLRQGLLFTDVYVRLSALLALQDSPVSTLHLTI